MGTPETAAPEQIEGGQVFRGPPADVYVLGVLAYQLLAGRPPFRGDVSSVLDGHLHRLPPPLRVFRPDLPEAVYVAVHAALEEPDRQPPSAIGFAGLLAAAAGSGSGAVNLAERESAPRQRRRESRAAGTERVPLRRGRRATVAHRPCIDARTVSRCLGR